jgi:opacity protein-like surface antigen
MTAALMVFLAALAVLAALATDAEAQKWEFSAFGGYRWGGKLNDGRFSDDLVSVSDLRFDSGPTGAVTAGYNLTSRFEIEALYDRQRTSFKFVNDRLGADQTLGNGSLDYLMAGFSVNLLPPEYKLMPYFTFYLGAMHLVPDESSLESSWFSAVGYALGVTYYFTEHVGVMAVHHGTSVVITKGESLLCDSKNERCIVLPSDIWMWQLGLSAGVVFTL